MLMKESLCSDTRRVILASQKVDDLDDTGLNAWVADVNTPDNQLIAHGEELLGDLTLACNLTPNVCYRHCAPFFRRNFGTQALI